MNQHIVYLYVQFTMVKLPYALSTIEPAIDNATMNFHYGVHYSTYINNTNAALANTTSIPPSSRKNLTGGGAKKAAACRVSAKKSTA